MLTFDKKHIFQKVMVDTFMPEIDFENPNFAPIKSNAIFAQKIATQKIS